MAKSFQHGEIRSTLKQHGMTEGDLAWLDGIGWNDASVPPVTNATEAAEYARREKALNGSISNLLAMDRIDRIESRLAAAIGAEIANWNERDEDE